jgi:hypothetical protein
VKQHLTRAVAVLSVCAASVMVAAPAWALDDGEAPHEASFSTLDGLLLFIGVPLLATLVIALLVYAPHIAKRPRYRPGRPYDAEPLWFDGPARPEAALDAAPSGESARGGGASASW